MIEIDDTGDVAAASGDYQYGAPYREGAQQAVIVWVKDEPHESAAGNLSLAVTLGLAPVAEGEYGAKVDTYVPLGSGVLDRLRRADFVACMLPEQKGKKFAIEPRALVGRKGPVEIVTEEGRGDYDAKPAVMMRPRDEEGRDGRMYVNTSGPARGWLPAGTAVARQPASAAPAPTSTDDDWLS